MTTQAGHCYVMWQAEWYQVFWNRDNTPIEVRAEKRYESNLPDHSSEVEKYALLWAEHEGYGQMKLVDFIAKMTDDWK